MYEVLIVTLTSYCHDEQIHVGCTIPMVQRRLFKFLRGGKSKSVEKLAAKEVNIDSIFPFSYSPKRRIKI